MAPKRLDSQRLGLVFQSRPDILDGIRAAADSPARVTLFNDIASFVYDQLQTSSEPAAKRRRVDDGPAGAMMNGAGSGAESNGVDPSREEVLLEIKEISVSVPQRKKFELCFTPKHLYARAPGTTGPVKGIVYAWQDIEHAFYLPVPEKAQVQHNYILFPRGSCLGPPKSAATPDAPEPLVFTVPATAPKQGTVGGRDAAGASAHSDDYRTLFHWALRTRLRAAGSSVDLVSADPSKFHSAIPQAHRPREKAVHVKAFRGSKDGYLFFLESGILWGYKKPLMFVPLDRVAAVSYTSVLQRTFNMVVEVFAGQGDESEEVEFAMVDQADFQGIDEYVRKKRLQDRSMAEARKAKMELAENMKGVKKEGAEGGAEEAEGAETVSALEAAQREEEQRLQDEEDELEEDYNPDDDDDSDGSGSSSDESDEEGGDDEDDEDEDGDEDGEGEGEEEDGEAEAEGEGEGEGEVEDEEAEGNEEGDREEEDEEMKDQVEVEVKREPKAGAIQAGLTTHDEDELAGAPYDAGYDDEMDLEEKFDVVG